MGLDPVGPFIYPVGNVIQRLTLRMFADYKVAGRENVPRSGPLIIVANHQSNFDPPLLGASVPRRIRFLAKDTIFSNPAFHWFLTSYGAFPLDRDGTDIRAYRWAFSTLQNGGTLALFPEGTRSRGELQRARTEVVRFASKLQAPLLPVGIAGTEHLRTWARAVNPTGRIRVKIGPVFSLPPIAGRPSPEVLGSLTDTIMGHIVDLLPERYHGVYGATREAVPTGPGPGE